MRRAPILPGVDLRVYLDALPILIKNPAIIVVPLLALIVGVVLQLTSASLGVGGLNGITASIISLVVALLQVFGLGSACIMADAAWRRGRVKFDDAWVETRRKTSDLIAAGFGVVLLMFIAQWIGQMLGFLAEIIMAIFAYGLIFAIPSAAIGGIPGGAAIQASVTRVRSAPLAAGILTAVAIAVGILLPGVVTIPIVGLFGGYVAQSLTALLVVQALIQSICISYVAIVMAKVYSEVTFTRRW